MKGKKISGWFVSTLLLCGVFAAAKLPFLDQPCSGDEAYPYSAAIFHLVEHGPSLAPLSVPADLSTGHPLLYYFLQAGWIKIFGAGAARIFPLLISCLALLQVFFFGKKFFSPALGFLCALLLATRSIFFIQSTLMLPEMLMLLLLLLTVQFYLERKWVFYAIAGSLLALTKEPALIFIGCIGLFSLARDIRQKTALQLLFKNMALISIPIISSAAFFLVQKIQMGWFFYPRHFGYMTFHAQSFFDKLFMLYGHSIFVFYGGIFMLACFFIFFLLNKIKPQAGKAADRPAPVALLWMLVIAYILFGSFNFASPRYMLCIYPFLFTLVLDQVFLFFQERKSRAVIVSAALSAIQLGYLADVRSNSDLDLRYLDANTVKKEVIAFLKKQKWENKKIYAPYFMEKYMENPSGGFVKLGEEFHHVSNSVAEVQELFIFPSDEQYSTEGAAGMLQLRLVRRFEKNGFSIDLKSR